jgi:lysozyme family protein
MADFYRFFPTLLKFEGGFVDDPADPGGATNKGVTFATFRAHARPLLNVRPTMQALKELSDEQAGRIYKVQYWDKILGDHIEFQPLAEIMFDFYVNAGSHAVALFYDVLNHAGTHHDRLNWIDMSAIRLLPHLNGEEIYMHYKEGRKAYYRTLAQQHPALRKFLKGWLNRVNSFPDFS